MQMYKPAQWDHITFSIKSNHIKSLLHLEHMGTCSNFLLQYENNVQSFQTMLFFQIPDIAGICIEGRPFQLD